MYRLISIIIPVYNPRKAFLETALDSLRAQTRTNWECICVDDESNGLRASALQETIIDKIRSDRRFRLICQPNKGIGKSRNRGLDAMRGDAFMHMDHDDLLPPNALEILEDAADASGAPMVAGHYLPFETIPESIPCAPGGRLLEGKSFRKKIFGTPHGLPFPAWAKLYDRSLLGHLRFLPLHYGDDVYYTPLIRHAAARCYLCNAVVYLWRKGHDSASNLHDCSPVWLEDYSASVLASARHFPASHDRKCIFKGVRWVGHRLFRCPSFRDNPDHWSPDFRRAVQTCCRNLLQAMPPFPSHPIWRLRLWLTLHKHLHLAKPLLPKH